MVTPIGSGAEIVELQAGMNAVDFTILDAQAVEKGALMQLTDPRTCSGSDTLKTGSPFAGIASAEKVALDGQINLALHTIGVFDIVTAGKAITAGELVALSGKNAVRSANQIDISGGNIVGRANEDGAIGEIIEIDIGVKG